MVQVGIKVELCSTSKCAFCTADQIEKRSEAKAAWRTSTSRTGNVSNALLLHNGTFNTLVGLFGSDLMESGYSPQGRGSDIVAFQALSSKQFKVFL